MEKKTTGTLTSILLSTSAESLNDYLDTYKDSTVEDKKAFADYMRLLFRNKGLRQQDVFISADISEGYGYKLIAEEKTTKNRDIILRLCIAGKLTLDETNRALMLYGMSPLYAKKKRDAVLIVAINTGIHDVYEVNELLVTHNMEPLIQN